MTSISSVDPLARPTHLTPTAALRYAWWSWTIMLLIPFFIFLWVGASLSMNVDAKAQTSTAGAWFLGCMIYLALAFPLAIFWRSHIFKAYWHGQVVSPKNYLSGMLGLWIPVEIGGILSLLGCLMSHQLLPGLMPAIIAFMLFTILWPSGSAMTRHTGNADDPQHYQEPR